MRIAVLPSVIALALGTWAVAAPAQAQAPVCPAGYYYASDGQCYPGGPPDYPAPAYDVAPPVYEPPVVLDGFGLGVGLGALAGGWGGGGDDRGDWGRGDGGRGGGGRGGGDRGGGGRGGGGRGGGRGHH